MVDLHFSDEHSKSLPTVRIKKVTLDNFRGVRHGAITFNCGRYFVPEGTEPDIMGIYGQNGSGKTTLVEAALLLEALLTGQEIPDSFSECIAKDSETATASFVFDFQYPDERVLQVGYEYTIGRIEKKKEEPKPEDEMSYDDQYPNKVKIVHEVIRVGGIVDGIEYSYRPAIDTQNTRAPFGPSTKTKLFYPKDKETVAELYVQKRLAESEGTSAIFRHEVLSIFIADGKNDTGFVRILKELTYFGRYYLHVYTNRHTGTINAKLVFPLYLGPNFLGIRMIGPQTLPNRIVDDIDRRLEGLNVVLTQVIPGLSLECQRIQPTKLKNGADGSFVQFVTRRNDIEIPLADESAGICKIISMLQFLIFAYTDKSATVFIDELDSGIYEYLLGELVHVIAESGRGQLIFTSHNLRPLEVLDKNSVCFTTTNPGNRYYRIKNVGSTYNLRDTYYREIVMGNQDEELYKRTNSYRIASAMDMAAVRHE